jgi:DNA-binding transcriptional ArsR family regulator
MDEMKDPRIQWDMGTAYDFFISLKSITSPSDFGLRPAWAAGVRSRLPNQEREALERDIIFLDIPFHWIHELPEPKDGATVLNALESIAPEERLAVLSFMPGVKLEYQEILHRVREQKAWNDEDAEAFADLVDHKKGYAGKGKTELVENTLNAWSHAAEFGEALLQAYKTYHEVFFAEEENRIRPALEQALEEAKAMAQRMSLQDLLEELSKGVRMDEEFHSKTVVLSPSFWGAPLLIFGFATDEVAFIAFGGRPPDASLVPGEVVPEDLMRALKALSDPTRLRILRYLSEEALSPSQLARRLRLRASTVVHHLNVLRLATLVQLTLGPGKDKKYAAREDRISAASHELHSFLGQDLSIETELTETPVHAP